MLSNPRSKIIRTIHMALDYYVSVLTLSCLHVRRQELVMEHQGPNCKSNVTTPVVSVRSYHTL